MNTYAQTTGEVAKYWEGNAESWTQLSRAGHDVYRDQLNTPVFLRELPDISNLAGLDIGCGEGTNTRFLAERGAKVHGVDVSATFIRHAKAVEASHGLGISYAIADATALPFPDCSFDFATSFMCLMDVADLKMAVAEACRIIRPGGFFQFSILHPCFSPPTRKNLRDAAGTVYAVELADYFVENSGRVEEWIYSSAKQLEGFKDARFRIPHFHRTLAGWINLLVDCGFVIEKLVEPAATEEQAKRFPRIADSRVVPLFLHIRVRKPATAQHEVLTGPR